MFDPQFYFNTHYLMLKSTHLRVIIKKTQSFIMRQTKTYLIYTRPVK